MKCDDFTLLLLALICFNVIENEAVDSYQKNYDLKELENEAVDTSCRMISDKKEHKHPKITEATCRCQKSTKTCSIHFKWAAPEIYPTWKYQLRINVGGDFDDTRCFNFKNTTTHFVFDKSNGWDSRINLYDYSLWEQPTNIEKRLPLKSIKCPQPITIREKFHSHTVNVDSSIVFNCSFKGYPLPGPNEIYWTHEKKRLRNNSYIEIINKIGLSSLTIRNIQKNHSGNYRCYGSNFFDQTDDKEMLLVVQDRPVISQSADTRSIIGASVGSCLILVVIMYILYRYSRNYSKKVLKRFTYEDKKVQVYVSYCYENETKKMALLKFLSQLNQSVPSLDIVVDLTRETEIAQAGGFPQWVPDSIAKADKLLVVLNNDYIKMLKEDLGEADSIEMTKKVRNEYVTISKILYEDGCMKYPGKLIIINDGVKNDAVPEYFRGMPLYKFPADLKAHADEFNKIVSLFALSKNGNESFV